MKKILTITVLTIMMGIIGKESLALNSSYTGYKIEQIKIERTEKAPRNSKIHVDPLKGTAIQNHR